MSEGGGWGDQHNIFKRIICNEFILLVYNLIYFSYTES